MIKANYDYSHLIERNIMKLSNSFVKTYEHNILRGGFGMSYSNGDKKLISYLITKNQLQVQRSVLVNP